MASRSTSLRDINIFLKKREDFVLRTVYVGNLEWKTTLDELKNHFSPYGQVTSVDIIKNRETGLSRGFAFVTLENAEKAIQELDGKEFRGRVLKINEARPRELRESREFREYPEFREPRVFRESRGGYREPREFRESGGGYREPREFRESREGYREPRIFRDYGGGHREPREFRDSRGGYREPREFREYRGYKEPRPT